MEKEQFKLVSTYQYSSEAIIFKEKLQLLSVVDNAKSFFSMLIAMLFFVLPFYTKYKYRCANCNYEVEQKTKL